VDDLLDHRVIRNILPGVQAIQEGQSSAEAWNALGAAHTKLGDYRRAREAWDQALRIDPTHAGALRNRQTLDAARPEPPRSGSKARTSD